MPDLAQLPALNQYAASIHSVFCTKEKKNDLDLIKGCKGWIKDGCGIFQKALLSLLLSLGLSIFNLNCSCNWLEGQQGGTLLVGCVMPHRSQYAGSPLPLKKRFCCNAEISLCLRRFIFLRFCLIICDYDSIKPGGFFFPFNVLKKPCGCHAQLSVCAIQPLSLSL